MKHPIGALSGVVLAAALFATFIPRGAAGQVTLNNVASVGPAWPPHPARIINLNSWNDPQNQNGQVTVGPNASIVVYTVPNDRWLVLTQGTAQGGGASPLFLEESLAANSSVRMELSGAVPFLSGPVGYVFRPGSQVTLKNEHPNYIASVNWNLVGYLTLN